MKKMSSVPDILVEVPDDGETKQGVKASELHTILTEDVTMKSDAVGVAKNTSLRRRDTIGGHESHSLKELNPSVPIKINRRKSMFEKCSNKTNLDYIGRNAVRFPKVHKYNGILPEIRLQQKSGMHENIDKVRRRISGLKPEMDVTSAFLSALSRHGSARPRSSRKVQ